MIPGRGQSTSLNYRNLGIPPNIFVNTVSLLDFGRFSKLLIPIAGLAHGGTSTQWPSFPGVTAITASSVDDPTKRAATTVSAYPSVPTITQERFCSTENELDTYGLLAK